MNTPNRHRIPLNARTMNFPADHYKRHTASSLAIGLCLVLTSSFSHATAPDEYFEKHVRPLLVNHCYACHSADLAEANLRLDTKAGWQAGGKSGPAIVPHKPSASLLIRAITDTNNSRLMPPTDADNPLTELQIEILTIWVRSGAFDPREGEQIETSIDIAAKTHWAFQPLSAPRLRTKLHPIDELVARQRRQAKITPVEPATTGDLIRRMTYDLHGLPPTAAQLQTPANEIQQLVSKLLASPRYGERWARHWLDVARYSDAKDGVLMYGDARIRPFAYTYRDYVIRAFNQDKPWSEFIREQLAADQLDLPAHSPDLAAMGLLTLGRLFDANIHDIIDDQIDVVSRGFLGLTTACARCHDHKFDPIPTADYYSMYGIFASSEEPILRPRIADVTAASAAFEDKYQQKLEQIKARQSFLYQRTLTEVRARTTQHFVKVATTEPDNAETTIFFLSLTPDQPRPSITYAWRQYIAQHNFSEDPVFGPWHDLMAEPTLRPQQWRDHGVDERLIAALIAKAPQTPQEIATIYGDLVTNIWETPQNLRDELSSLLDVRKSLGKRTLNLADIVTGGHGLSRGESDLGIHPSTGAIVKGSTGFVEVKNPDVFSPSKNKYVDGVFVPQKLDKQVISSTGLTIDGVPTNLSGSWDYVRSGPPSGYSSTTIDDINYGTAPHWCVALHANKGITFDLTPLREFHSVQNMTFQTILGHVGEKEKSTLDVTIYVNGQQVSQHLGIKAQQAGIPIRLELNPNTQFLTFLVTQGIDGISHDQAILGDARFEIEADKSYLEHIASKAAVLDQKILELRRQINGLPALNEDPIAQLLLSSESPSSFSERNVYHYLARQDKDAFRGLVNELDGIAVKDNTAADRAMVMVDKPVLCKPVIFQRGDAAFPGNPVPRQFLKILSTAKRIPYSSSSGRLNLANAIANPDNPLTARVWVNRVWMHLFGSPLVENPSDFGLNTLRPLQHELLDLLAIRFIESGFRTKALHRFIMSSATYRLSSFISENPKLREQHNVDPDNSLLWHANRRRLDLEQMRDTLLMVAGKLDDTMYGRPLLITDENNYRRTVYAFVERQNLPNIVQIFDAASADTSTARRVTTTVPQQALFALNSKFVTAMAQSLTNRLTEDQPVDKIDQLYRLTLGRTPTPHELQLGGVFLQENSWLDYAQVLLISNELWFID
ncbi:MAG: DUF1553 domain-containing protein [Planctomycetaceae bacterium]|jgi:hypothetical protein|nr:DUF1553 domain-containing protein [Planctomycetaceae bacterium]MBT4724488.1 DUF1553 domain-containing protein [Planctomycetaceae bacterium]MBT7917404.1 DUF1553 domain-containing protein [Planctomycetaceae bacterium]